MLNLDDNFLQISGLKQRSPNLSVLGLSLRIHDLGLFCSDECLLEISYQMFVLGLWELTSYYAVAKLRQYIYIFFFLIFIFRSSL